MLSLQGRTQPVGLIFDCTLAALLTIEELLSSKKTWLVLDPDNNAREKKVASLVLVGSWEARIETLQGISAAVL